MTLKKTAPVFKLPVWRDCHLNCWVIPLYEMSCLSLAIFYMLSLIFCRLLTMSLVIFSFEFILFESQWTSGIFKFMSFTKVGEFWAIIFSNIYIFLAHSLWPVAIDDVSWIKRTAVDRPLIMLWWGVCGGCGITKTNQDEMKTQETRKERKRKKERYDKK